MNWQNWYTDFSKLLCGFVKVVHILRLLPAKIKPIFRWKRNKCEARQFLVGTTKPILLFTRLSPSAEVKRPQRQPFRLFATTNNNFLFNSKVLQISMCFCRNSGRMEKCRHCYAWHQKVKEVNALWKTKVHLKASPDIWKNRQPK